MLALLGGWGVLTLLGGGGCLPCLAVDGGRGNITLLAGGSSNIGWVLLIIIRRQ